MIGSMTTAAMSTVAHGHPACTTGSVRRIPRHNVTCGAQQSGLKHEPARPADMDRRSTLISIGTSAAAALVAIAAPPGAIAKGKTQTAGDFLPPTSDGYVLYTPNGQSTPSIRAGVIKQEDGFYTFELPAKWVEGTILNILSGNFCMPGCNEPWVEALWESPTEGAAKLVVSPLYRLINKPNATLKDVGTPEAVAEKIGAFITGNYLDSIEDVTAMGTQEFADGRTYYTYEVVAPYGKEGQHFLAALTVKGDHLYLWVLAASEKQFAKSQGTLRHMLTSFKA